jgi:hypothetical protein
MMLNANDPEFSARYPYGATVRDRWGRLIPGVIACDQETGEVISYDGTWLTGEWLRLTVVTRHMFRWVSPFSGFLQCHSFWPAPLTVEGKRPASIATIRERLADCSGCSGRPGVLTLAQLDDLMTAVEPPTP